VEKNLRGSALKALGRYLDDHSEHLSMLEHIEQVVELKLHDGIVVNGRIDLIRRTDTKETVIVDFKSDERAQIEDITQKQLHVYAVGYQQLTGKTADLIEIHNLDKGGAKRELIDNDLMQATLAVVKEAGQKLKENHLPRLSKWCETCDRCDHIGICRAKPK
jgi:DNA helicase-2/ATP-dependent DNA helicase PcrA